MPDALEPTGLISGYLLRADQPLEPVSWDGMANALACEDGMVWLHFDLADARVQRWIAASERIPQGARDVLLGSDNHVRLEAIGNGLVGVLGDLHHDFHRDPSEVGVLRLYLDDRCLISARHRPLKAVDGLRRAVADGLRVERPVSLIIHLLNHLADALGSIIVELGDSVDDLEDGILDGRLDDRSGELGGVRRLVARLRWHMVPQRHALIGLLDSLPSWLSKPDLHGLRRAIERLEAVTHDLDLVQERARLLQDELGTRLREMTNRNLYVLSIVTTIFLPITLITGIFGMNVGGLPGTQVGTAFWWVVGGMATTVVSSLVILRWKKLF